MRNRGEQGFPVFAKVAMDSLVGVDPKKFSYDDHRDDFTIGESGLPSSSPQRLPGISVLEKGPVGAVDKAVDRENKIG